MAMVMAMVMAEAGVVEVSSGSSRRLQVGVPARELEHRAAELGWIAPLLVAHARPGPEAAIPRGRLPHARHERHLAVAPQQRMPRRRARREVAEERRLQPAESVAVVQLAQQPQRRPRGPALPPLAPAAVVERARHLGGDERQDLHTVARVRPAVVVVVLEEDLAHSRAAILVHVPVYQHGTARQRRQHDWQALVAAAAAAAECGIAAAAAETFTARPQGAPWERHVALRSW